MPVLSLQTLKQKTTILPSTGPDLVVAEVDINDTPLSVRNLLTRGITQEEISRYSGATISTRGRYIKPGDKPQSLSDRSLYLCIQSSSRRNIDLAVEKIHDIISTNSATRQSRFSPADSISRPNFSAALSSLVNTNLSNSTDSGLSFVQEKLYIGLEHAPPVFDVKGKITGPAGMYLMHIQQKTAAKVTLRGKGSGFLEPDSGREAFEPMHIHLQHPTRIGLQQAKDLAINLITTVQQDYAQFQSSLAAMPPNISVETASLLAAMQQPHQPKRDNNLPMTQAPLMLQSPDGTNIQKFCTDKIPVPEPVLLTTLPSLATPMQTRNNMPVSVTNTIPAVNWPTVVPVRSQVPLQPLIPLQNVDYNTAIGSSASLSQPVVRRHFSEEKVSRTGNKRTPNADNTVPSSIYNSPKTTIVSTGSSTSANPAKLMPPPPRSVGQKRSVTSNIPKESFKKRATSALESVTSYESDDDEEESADDIRPAMSERVYQQDRLLNSQTPSNVEFSVQPAQQLSLTHVGPHQRVHPQNILTYPPPMSHMASVSETLPQIVVPHQNPMPPPAAMFSVPQSSQIISPAITQMVVPPPNPIQQSSQILAMPPPSSMLGQPFVGQVPGPNAPQESQMFPHHGNVSSQPLAYPVVAYTSQQIFTSMPPPFVAVPQIPIKLDTTLDGAALPPPAIPNPIINKEVGFLSQEPQTIINVQPVHMPLPAENSLGLPPRHITMSSVDSMHPFSPSASMHSALPSNLIQTASGQLLHIEGPPMQGGITGQLVQHSLTGPSIQVNPDGLVQHISPTVPMLNDAPNLTLPPPVAPDTTAILPVVVPGSHTIYVNPSLPPSPHPAGCPMPISSPLVHPSNSHPLQVQPLQHNENMSLINVRPNIIESPPGQPNIMTALHSSENSELVTDGMIIFSSPSSVPSSDEHVLLRYPAPHIQHLHPPPELSAPFQRYPVPPPPYPANACIPQRLNQWRIPR